MSILAYLAFGLMAAFLVFANLYRYLQANKMYRPPKSTDEQASSTSRPTNSDSN